MNPSRRQAGKTLPAIAFDIATLGLSKSTTATNTIAVGVLHSFRGTTTVAETVLEDTALMAIDEMNSGGGFLGKKL